MDLGSFRAIFLITQHCDEIQTLAGHFPFGRLYFLRSYRTADDPGKTLDNQTSAPPLPIALPGSNIQATVRRGFCVLLATLVGHQSFQAVIHSSHPLPDEACFGFARFNLQKKTFFYAY